MNKCLGSKFLRFLASTLIITVSLVVLLVLTGCSSNQLTCYYAYFEDSAYSLIYSERTNTFYSIKLPLEQILLWGKASGLDSIPTAMRNYVGMKDSGFLLGSANSIATVRDVLDVLGAENGDSGTGAGNGLASPSRKRVETLVAKAHVLSEKPLLDKITKLCGQDAQNLLKLLDEKSPKIQYYETQSFFDTDDLNFSQRYFTQWLEQVLGGE